MNKFKTFALFLLCGGAAACVNLSSRWVASHWLAYPIAITLAYMAGMLTGFLLFKFCVFDSGKSRRLMKETLWYIAVNLFALAQTLAISILLAEYVFPWAGVTFYPHDVAHLIGVTIPVITSYFGHKYCTFH
jgi:putative flippase GtrA